MYEAMDRHSWVYDTKVITNKLKKQIDALKEENQELKEKIDKFTPHLDDDLNYIDGHYCYREVANTTINKAKWKNGGFELALECRIIYKDIDTGEIIATRVYDQIYQEK